MNAVAYTTCPKYFRRTFPIHSGIGVNKTLEDIRLLTFNDGGKDNKCCSQIVLETLMYQRCYIL